MADGFAKEMTFHPPFILKEELATAGIIEKHPSVTILEVPGVEDLVTEQVEGEGIDEGRPEWF